MENNKVILSIDAKKAYLERLSKRLIKILYLIEDENKMTDEQKEGSPAYSFIVGQLFDVNASNILFDNALIDVVIKLNGIAQYATTSYATIRKQVFEAKAIVDHLLKTL